MNTAEKFDDRIQDSLAQRMARAGWLTGTTVTSRDVCRWEYSKAGLAVHLRFAGLFDTARNDKSFVKRHLALLKFLLLLAWIRGRYLGTGFTAQEIEAWKNHVSDFCLQYLKNQNR